MHRSPRNESEENTPLPFVSTGAGIAAEQRRQRFQKLYAGLHDLGVDRSPARRRPARLPAFPPASLRPTSSRTVSRNACWPSVAKLTSSLSPVKISVEQRALSCQRPQHALLDAVAHHQIEHLHRPMLAHAMHAGDALLQHRRVPRHFQIDDRVGRLQVQAGAARVGAEKDPALRLVAEALQQRCAAPCRGCRRAASCSRRPASPPPPPPCAASPPTD